MLPVNPDEETHPIVVQDMFEEHHKTIGVYLGFLQEDHKYEVRFKVALDSLVGFISAKMDRLVLKSEPEFCVIQETNFNDLKHMEVVAELQIRHVTNFEDKFTLQSESEPQRFIHVRIFAQILGKSFESFEIN